MTLKLQHSLNEGHRIFVISPIELGVLVVLHVWKSHKWHFPDKANIL